MSAYMPDLQVDECDGLIELTQANGLDDPDCVRLHPMHLRYLVERFGPVETSEPRTLKAIATLKRRLRVLFDRIEELDDYLHKYSDIEHADMEGEQNYSRASWSIASEFIADLDADKAAEAIPKTDVVQVPAGSLARQHAIMPAEMGAFLKDQAASVATQSSGQTLAWAFRQALGESSAKFVLVVMAQLAGDSGICSPSVQDLATATGQDRKTVQANLKRLRDGGLIVDTGARKGATGQVIEYRLATDREYVPVVADTQRRAGGARMNRGIGNSMTTPTRLTNR